MKPLALLLPILLLTSCGQHATPDASTTAVASMPVTYVIDDVAGEVGSPVYAIFNMNAALKQLDTRAFGVCLILIYVLMVGWFRSFTTPAVVMMAIPFSLVGILPAHGLMGAFFTATSMIGFMAGGGIVVRNSIILVDFIELRLREGMPLSEAVIDAGAVRFRPMLLTAMAVVVGAAVILADPIFQGLAIALMAGEVASLLISRMAVPVLYYLVNHRTPLERVSDITPAPDAKQRDINS